MSFRFQHWVLGYGSLLSHDSRVRHSALDVQVIPASISGWQRRWITRYTDEKQTYVGATPQADARLNGALMPTEEITPELQRRELNYRFTPIQLNELAFWQADKTDEYQQLLTDKQLWICESLAQDWPDTEHPITQSYVDTCLAGCLENGGEDFAQQFIQDTAGWQLAWVNDRAKPQYPRAAQVERAIQARIDQLLQGAGILRYRRTL